MGSLTMDELEYCHRLRIETATLQLWIEQRWIVPADGEQRSQFAESDVARGRLIVDLIEAMGVNDSGIDVAMNLLDQIHGLRGKLQDVMDAVRAQDPQVQSLIFDCLEKGGSQR